jgi:hypothetical protein
MANPCQTPGAPGGWKSQLVHSMLRILFTEPRASAPCAPLDPVGTENAHAAGDHRRRRNSFLWNTVTSGVAFSLLLPVLDGWEAAPAPVVQVDFLNHHVGRF